MKNDFIKKQIQQKQTQKKQGVPKWQVWLLLAFMLLWTIGSVLGGVAFVKADVPQSYSVITDKPFDVIPDTNDLYGIDNFSMPNNSNFDKFSDKVILIDKSFFDNNTTFNFHCKYSTNSFGTGSLAGLGFRNYITGSNYTNTFHIYIDILYENEHYIFRIYDYIMNKTTNVGTFIYIPSGIITCSVGDYSVDIFLGTSNPISSISDRFIPYMKTFFYDLSYSNAYKTGFELGYNQGFNDGKIDTINGLTGGIFGTNDITNCIGYVYSSYEEQMTGNGSLEFEFTTFTKDLGKNAEFYIGFEGSLYEASEYYDFDKNRVDYGYMIIPLDYPIPYGATQLFYYFDNNNISFTLFGTIDNNEIEVPLTRYETTGELQTSIDLSYFMATSLKISFIGNWNVFLFGGENAQFITSMPDNAYSNAYNKGYTDGLASSNKIDYNKGYEQGLKDGEAYAKDYWYNQGAISTNENSFFSLITAVVDAPIQVLRKTLEFEILGVDMSKFFFSLMTLSIVLVVVRLVLLKM